MVFMGKSVRQLPLQLTAFCLPRKSGMGQPQGQARSFIPLSPGHDQRGNALQVAKSLPNALHAPSQSATRLRPIRPIRNQIARVDGLQITTRISSFHFRWPKGSSIR